MNTQFTFGADPEVFVKYKGTAVSVYETGLQGDKKTPFKTTVGAVQQDGFAAEFNIDPVPAHDFERFNQNIVRTIADLRDELNKSGRSYNLAIQPVMEFDPEYMAAQPDSVKELGCDPDFNAYTLEANPRPDGDRAFRSGAGHIHYGWGADIPVDNEDHLEICAGFIKTLDATVGMFMCFIDRDARRRDLYGKAGAFRPKPYGVEYRTPSNLWITTKDRRYLVHALSNFAISQQTRGLSVEKMTGGYTSESIQDFINNGDFDTARYVVDRYVGQLEAYPYNNRLVGPAWSRIKSSIAAELAKAA
jgi:hypothetical protein